MRLEGRWAPAIVLALGALLATVGVKAQRALPLRTSLQAAVPVEIAGATGRDFAVSPAELKVAAVTSYLFRNYASSDTAAGGFSVYVGYYDQQTQGKTVHSPKNCLPGAGWEPLAATTQEIGTASGPVTVNRYILKKGAEQALVLYWYQGRGRVAWNEYRVKWDLLRDAALRRRSDEALVRIVVPVRHSEDEALVLAKRAASRVADGLGAALPS